MNFGYVFGVDVNEFLLVFYYKRIAFFLLRYSKNRWWKRRMKFATTTIAANKGGHTLVPPCDGILGLERDIYF